LNPFWTEVIVQTILRRKQGRAPGREAYSPRELAKGFRELRITVLRMLRDLVLISLGIFAAGFGLESFLLPNSFIDGGVTGISLLVAEITGVPLYLLILLLNIPFIILGFGTIGRQFAFKTSLAISGLALVVATMHFPEVTHDKLLVSVFGGFFLGAGIGLSVRGGGVLDGTDILAIFISRKIRSTIGDTIMLINIAIFSSAAYFLSVETALYSLLTYLAATKTLDFVVEGIEEYLGVTIISAHSEEIRIMLTDNLRRGVTVYKGQRGFGKSGYTKDVDIIYSVITRLEISKLQTEVEKIDPNAFVVMSSVKDTKGGMIKKRPLKE
jgi:uncharacterized membrane-anchored protein YitT (DUF2179 family)